MNDSESSFLIYKCRYSFLLQGVAVYFETLRALVVIVCLLAGLLDLPSIHAVLFVVSL